MGRAGTVTIAEMVSRDAALCKVSTELVNALGSEGLRRHDLLSKGRMHGKLEEIVRR